MYRYFMSYTWQNRDDGTGAGHMWVDRPTQIKGPEDLAELVTALKDAESRLARTEIIVLNFQQVAPWAEAEIDVNVAAWTGRTDREAAALAEVESLMREAQSGFPMRRPDLDRSLRRIREILDGGR